MSDLRPSCSTTSAALATASPARTRTAAAVRMRHADINLLLWTLQGWLVMFYAGTGYAKVSQPLESLTLLMAWPRGIDAEVVRLLGLMDIGLALGMVVPLLSWRFGRPVLLGAAAVMLASQMAFIAYYGVEHRAGMMAINLILVGITMTVIKQRWSWRA